MGRKGAVSVDLTLGDQPGHLAGHVDVPGVVGVLADHLFVGVEEDRLAVARSACEESVEGAGALGFWTTVRAALVDVDGGVGVGGVQRLGGVEEDPRAVARGASEEASKAPLPLISPWETQVVVPPERS